MEYGTSSQTCSWLVSVATTPPGACPALSLLPPPGTRSYLNAAVVLGGAFGFTLPRSVAMFSIVYWGREAFERLAAGQGDITLHVLVLLIQGAVMYAIGVWLFNRRMTV
jgi:hypothetical protein